MNDLITYIKENHFDFSNEEIVQALEDGAFLDIAREDIDFDQTEVEEAHYYFKEGNY